MSISFKSSTPIRTMKPISLALALAAVSIFSQTSQAKLADAPSQEDIVALQESVINLEESLSNIQSQYQELYNLLNKEDNSNTAKLTNLSSLFQESSTNSPVTISGNTISIRDDASIYLGDQKLLDVIKSWTKSEQADNQTQSAGFSSMSGASFMAAPTVSYSEFQNVANTVLALNTRISTAEKDIKTISASIAEIKKSQNSTEELLTEALGELEVKVNSLQDTIVEGENGGFKSSMSPIENAIPPDCTPSLYSGSGYFASSFTVSKSSRLKTVTLYCGNISYLVPAKNICIVCNDNAYAPAYAQSVSTANSKYPVYTFAASQMKPDVKDILDLKAGNTYYLVINTGKLYVCDRYRGEGVSKGNIACGSGYNGPVYVFASETTDTKKEIWSKFDLGKAELSFDDNGLAISNGGLSVNGSSVITESTLRNAVKTELQNASGAFNGGITYDMFNSALKNKLLTTSGGTVSGSLKVSGALAASSATVGGKSVITTAGGTMTGNLTVQGQVILPNNGAWNVGTESAPSDLVIVNPSSRIRSQSGNLKVAAQNGDIVAESFVQHSLSQCGKVTIAGESASVEVPGITEDAIVMLTPNQEPKQKYWYRVNESTHMLIIYRDETASDTLSLDYFVIRK